MNSEVENLIIDLRELLLVTKRFEKDKAEFDEAENHLNEAKQYIPQRLRTFDSQYKEKYISDIVGKKPKPLSKWNPLNLSKRARVAAKKAEDEYFDKRNHAEKDYLKKYKDKRAQFEKEDNEDKENRITEATRTLEDVRSKLERSKYNWENSIFLASSLRKSDVIEKMITYFNEGRVDTLKEAINLYYDDVYKEEEKKLAEEHRQKLEKLIEAQNKSIQDAIEKAEEAASDAEAALSLANDAMERADEAYNHADNAYNSSGNE